MAVRVTRPGVIRGDRSPADLLVGEQVASVLRHGKQLALVSDKNRCVSVHLGMSGQLCILPWPDEYATKPTKVKRTSGPKSSTPATNLPAHTHVLWELEGGLAIRFTDPRRFGGLWTFAQLDDLQAQRWSKLGPDAMQITSGALYSGLKATRRALKAALLDQHLVAGLGNIYVDELLFGAKLHPLRPANTISRTGSASLVRRMRTLLSGAIDRGGSSLRDYVDAESRRGRQQDRHRVYGRAGQRCLRRGCDGSISSHQIAGRTTAWCPRCQIKSPSR